jgi:hypothetical protein
MQSQRMPKKIATYNGRNKKIENDHAEDRKMR